MLVAPWLHATTFVLFANKVIYMVCIFIIKGCCVQLLCDYNNRTL